MKIGKETNRRPKSVYTLLSNGCVEYDIDHRIVRPDGEVRHVHAQGEASYDENGMPTHVLGITMDITERKQAEAALRESEERYRSIFENSPHGILHLDENGVIVSCDESNARIIELFFG